MKKYDQVTPIKITVEGGLCPDRSLQLTLHPYATIEEWIDTFKVMLLHQTFSEDTIKELFDPQIDYAIDDESEDIISYDDEVECGISKESVERKQESYNWKKEF